MSPASICKIPSCLLVWIRKRAGTPLSKNCSKRRGSHTIRAMQLIFMKVRSPLEKTLTAMRSLTPYCNFSLSSTYRISPFQTYALQSAKRLPWKPPRSRSFCQDRVSWHRRRRREKEPQWIQVYKRTSENRTVAEDGVRKDGKTGDVYPRVGWLPCYAAGPGRDKCGHNVPLSNRLCLQSLGRHNDVAAGK